MLGWPATRFHSLTLDWSRSASPPTSQLTDITTNDEFILKISLQLQLVLTAVVLGVDNRLTQSFTHEQYSITDRKNDKIDSDKKMTDF